MGIFTGCYRVLTQRFVTSGRSASAHAAGALFLFLHQRSYLLRYATGRALQDEFILIAPAWLFALLHDRQGFQRSIAQPGDVLFHGPSPKDTRAADQNGSASTDHSLSIGCVNPAIDFDGNR